MKKDLQQLYFEKRYRSRDYYWGTEPNKITKKIAEYVKLGTLLDIGAGDGNDAMFMAQKGFRVTCVDYSKEAMKKLRFKAKKPRLTVNCLTEDIRKFKYASKFDVIMSFATLHFMGQKDIIKVIKKMKSNTKPGGINAISAFTERNPYKGFPYLLKKSELKGFYNDWDILYYSERFTPWERHEDGAPLHRHAVAYIIARNTKKPKTS